jgi:hypothetical protein
MFYNIMVKTTPLTDVVGRVDYISSPDRQEHLVYADKNCADTEFWKQLSEHCQATALGREKVREGREFILPLPNWMYKEMYPDDVAERFQQIIDAKTGTKSAVAIHWNRKGNSYHMHIVCSENEELPEPEPVKVREPLKRDTYFNAAGKRSPKKECVDAETKQLLPGCSVIRKGQTQPDQLEVRRFSNKNRKISSREFLNELKQDFANELNDLMYEYGHDNDYFVVADFRTPDNVYLKQLSKPKGLPEQTCERIDLYNQTAKEYNEVAGALVQHYPEAVHTDELEQIAQLMNRKSAADRDGFVGAVREITKALQMQFAAARAAAARPKVSSVAEFSARYRDRSNLDAAGQNLNRVLGYFRAAIEDDDDKGAARRYYEMTAKRERDEWEEER